MLKSSQPGGVPPGGPSTNGSNNTNNGTNLGQPPPNATTPQTPPETPETNSPPSVGPPTSMLPTTVVGGGTGPVSQSLGSTNVSLSNNTVSPSAMSPPITSWDMNPAKAAMANSYMPQYPWYHHGHDPSINQQLLT